MKILQVNSVYGKGSTGKIVSCIHNGLLENGYQSIVCYGRGKKSREKNIIKISSETEAKIHSVFSRLFGVDFGYSFFATNKLINIIKNEKPDVVHLHCLNSHFVNVYKLLNYLKTQKIKTVLTLHAEIMHTAGCEHAYQCTKWKTECSNCNLIKGALSSFFRDDAKHCYYLMKECFEKYDNLTIVGVSDWLLSLAKESPVINSSPKAYVTIHNGIDTSIFHYSYDENIKRRYNIEDNKKVVLHVTPNFLSDVKGGKYVIELAKRMINYIFVVVGYNGITDNLPNNIIPIRHTNNQVELAKLYSVADCFICTSKCESLPTVCIEAISCGGNVVAFDVGGVKETIPEERGAVVAFGDLDDFEKKVIEYCNEGKKNIGVDNELDYKRMVNDYIKVYGGV